MRGESGNAEAAPILGAGARLHPGAGRCRTRQHDARHGRHRREDQGLVPGPFLARGGFRRTPRAYGGRNSARTLPGCGTSHSSRTVWLRATWCGSPPIPMDSTGLWDGSAPPATAPFALCPPPMAPWGAALKQCASAFQGSDSEARSSARSSPWWLSQFPLGRTSPASKPGIAGMHLVDESGAQRASGVDQFGREQQVLGGDGSDQGGQARSGGGGVDDAELRRGDAEQRVRGGETQVAGDGQLAATASPGASGASSRSEAMSAPAQNVPCAPVSTSARTRRSSASRFSSAGTARHMPGGIALRLAW